MLTAHAHTLNGQCISLYCIHLHFNVHLKKKSKGKKGKKGKKGSGKGGEAPEKVKLQWPWFNKLSQWMGPTDKTRVPLRRQFRFTYLDRRANFPLCEYDRAIESRLDYLCLVLCAICVMCNV